MNEQEDIHSEFEKISPTERDDMVVESAVLKNLLVLHPTQIVFDELVREIADDPEEFVERDAIQRAVRDLVAAGLLHRSGDIVFPSRAALRFDELMET